MKYGLIVFQDTDNIGDDILSYAASRFLPKIDYFIDREEMDIFCPKEQEIVYTIMNGWYLYNKFSWPPSPFIKPFIVGMHLAQNDYLGIGYDYISGKGKEFFQQFQPIGCRDSSTLAVLLKNEIEAYFSGCLTLTLDKFPDISQEDKIYLVDVSTKIEEKVRTMTTYPCSLLSHNLEISKRGGSWESRVEQVEQYLKKYQSARLVVTSRLHVALPCLALGTPVILIYDEKEADRFSDYLPFLQYITEEEFLNSEVSIDINQIKVNQVKHHTLRNDLINACNAFVSTKDKSEQPELLPDRESFLSVWVERASWQKKLLAHRRNRLEEALELEKKWNHELIEAREWLEEESKKKDSVLQEMLVELYKKNIWIEDRNEAVDYLGKELQSAKEKIAEDEVLLHKIGTNLSRIKGNRLIRILIRLFRIPME